MKEDTTWDLRGVSAPDSPKNKVFHRREGVAEFFKTIEDTQDVLDHDVINFIASGDKVVSIGFFRARVKQTGKEVASDWAQVWTRRDGLVFEWKVFFDASADALPFQQ